MRCAAPSETRCSSGPCAISSPGTVTPTSWADFEHLASQESGHDLTGFFTSWARSTVIPPEPFLHPGTPKETA